MILLSIRSVARLTTGVTLGSALACASAPGPAGAPDAPVIRRDTVSTIPQQPSGIPVPGLSLNYTTGTHAYDLVQTTVVSVGSDSIGTTQDTLLSTASLKYSMEHVGDTLRVIATIDSLIVRSARDSTGPRSLTAPVTTVLEPRVSEPIPLATDSTTVPASCDSMDESARAIARDIHIRLPANALPRQRWTDSTSAQICRGGIPMTATTVSVFEIRDTQARGDSLIIEVRRQSTLALTGAGLQGARRITVTGTGTSESTFTYDLRAGVFLESQGQSVLQLRFETIQQTEQVTQRSATRVRRRG